MSLTTISANQALHSLAQFDTIIDARSPSEFALDRLPHAVNWPSLDDQERIKVGTLYKQTNAFEAKKMGAALVARNIASHIEAHVLAKTKSWKPLVYCWRGGNRSGALALVLQKIGFAVHLIEGGYKAFRAELVADIACKAQTLTFRVICAPTGSGKTRLLQALHAQGAQILDLEALAEHRSSVLGSIPGTAQPTQKNFDTRVWQALQSFDPKRVVFVESESKKVGNVTIPEALMQAMRNSLCLRLDLPIDLRVALLLEDYRHFVENPEFFCQRLEVLTPIRGTQVVQDWMEAVRQGRLAQVVEELLCHHYDPSYASSMQRNFMHYAEAEVNALTEINSMAFSQLAMCLRC